MRWLLSFDGHLPTHALEAGLAPIHVAASAGAVPLAKVLISYGALVGHPDRNHASTPLHRAAHNNNKVCVLWNTARQKRERTNIKAMPRSFF